MIWVGCRIGEGAGVGLTDLILSAFSCPAPCRFDPVVIVRVSSAVISREPLHSVYLAHAWSVFESHFSEKEGSCR